MDKYNGNLQYVGARYVPKIAEPYEYDPEMAYEPLTIVGYKNASYTSKKYVPAGVNPTTAEYWANTGNYNAQVEQYRRETAEYKNSVGQYKTQVDEYQANVDAYKNTVADVSKKTQNALVQIDNVAKLKQYTGEYPVLLMGYYAAGDNEPIVYNIVSEGADDGGSAIRLDNGKFAVAVLGDYVTPDTFGCQSDNDTTAENAWSKFQKYITNNKKSVKLLGKEYKVYNYLEVPANIVGVPGESILRAAKRIPVVSNTQVVENISLAHSALIHSHNREANKWRVISGVTLECGTLCDTGMFFANTNRLDISNIKIVDAIECGILLSRVWETKLNNIYLYQSTNCQYSIYVGGIKGEYTTNTSITMDNVYTNGNNHTYTEVYHFENLLYSSFGTIFCDSCVATNIFSFSNCQMSVGAIGSEVCTCTNYARLTNATHLVIDGMVATSEVNYEFGFSLHTAFLKLTTRNVAVSNKFLTFEDGSTQNAVILHGLSVARDCVNPSSPSKKFMVLGFNNVDFFYLKDSTTYTSLLK